MRSLLVALAGAVALIGCTQPQKQPDPIPPAPQIVSFTASRTMVNQGESTVLSWQTRDATSVEITQVNVGKVSGVPADRLSGSVEVTVTGDALFVLVAQNARGVRENAAVAVSVQDGAQAVLFAATPDEVAAGGAVTLSWYAPGASSVAIATTGGQTVDVGAQREVGTVTVHPVTDTTWVLTADDKKVERSVLTTPVVANLSATPASAVPGEDLVISWKTVGASAVTLSLAGAGELYSETDASKVADGSFTFQVPLSINSASSLPFTLTATTADGQRGSASQLTVFVAGSPRVRTVTIPTYAPLGGTFNVAWTTTGADSVQVIQDGNVVYVSPNFALAQSGNVDLPTLGQDTVIQVRATSSRGGVDLSAPKTVNPVDKPTVTTFSATPDAVAAGGDPVTITWDVPYARNLTITAKDQFAVYRASGVNCGQGSLTVYPNTNTEYVLTADNGLGDTITPATVPVTVGTSAQIVYGPSTIPIGGKITITGTTVASGGALQGLPNVQVNPPGEQFIDISSTGTNTGFTGTDNNSQLVTLPQAFSGVVFGNPVTATKLNISINGWMAFRTSSFTGPDGTAPNGLHAALPAGSIAPYFADLVRGTAGAFFYRMDLVDGEQRLIVQWNNIALDGAPGSELTFQAQVYASGKIVFAYSRLVGVSATTPIVGAVDNGTWGSLTHTGAAPVQDDVISLFDWAMPPLSIRVGTAPIRIRQQVGSSFLVVESTIPLLPAGTFTVSEVNHDPVTGKDQWIEVRNNTATDFDLNGWVMDFGGGVTHTINQSVIIPANGYALLGQTSDAAELTSGGPAVNYVWGNSVGFAAGGGSLGFSYSDSPAFASMAWTTATQGRSSQFGAEPEAGMLYSSATPVSELCDSWAAYGASGQRGTPGAVNTGCFPYALQPAAPNGFQSILATGTVVGALSGSTSTDSKTEELILPRPVTILRNSYGKLYVSSNGLIMVNSTTTSYSSNDATPKTSAPNGVVAPFWDDLVGNTSNSAVMWQQFDPDATPGSGDEYTLISWENWKRWGTVSSLNFQVKFFEGTGDIEFHFGTMTSSDTDGLRAKGSEATTWIEGLSGTSALPVNVNTAGLAPNTGFRFVPR